MDLDLVSCVLNEVTYLSDVQPLKRKGEDEGNHIFRVILSRVLLPGSARRELAAEPCLVYVGGALHLLGGASAQITS